MSDKKILFIGDSITDAFRTSVNDQCLLLGAGYPLLIAAQLQLAEPQVCRSFVNRGISGNRVTDLYARWEEDVLKRKPDVLSILIGVNDIWHEFQDGTGTSIGRFERTYDLLLQETKAELPHCTIMVLEPFILPCGVILERQADWIEEMRLIRLCVRAVAERNGCVFVPLQEPLEAAARLLPPECLLADGVHPVGAGHMLIAREWRKAFDAFVRVK